MTQGRPESFIEETAEELVRLYLRLNGYFVLAGYLLHRTAGAGQGIRAEIDALAVRFPHQREPLHTSPYPAQPNDPRLILPDDVRLVDFVVAEVKAGTSPPRFNAPLTNRGRGADRNVEDVLSMLGCFAEEAEIKTAAQAILSQLARPSREAPATYDLKSGVARAAFYCSGSPARGDGSTGSSSRSRTS